MYIFRQVLFDDIYISHLDIHTYIDWSHTVSTLPKSLKMMVIVLLILGTKLNRKKWSNLDLYQEFSIRQIGEGVHFQWKLSYTLTAAITKKCQCKCFARAIHILKIKL